MLDREGAFAFLARLIVQQGWKPAWPVNMFRVSGPHSARELLDSELTAFGMQDRSRRRASCLPPTPLVARQIGMPWRHTARPVQIGGRRGLAPGQAHVVGALSPHPAQQHDVRVPQHACRRGHRFLSHPNCRPTAQGDTSAHRERGTHSSQSVAAFGHSLIDVHSRMANPYGHRREGTRRASIHPAACRGTVGAQPRSRSEAHHRGIDHYLDITKKGSPLRILHQPASEPEHKFTSIPARSRIQCRR